MRRLAMTNSTIARAMRLRLHCFVFLVCVSCDNELFLLLTSDHTGPLLWRKCWLVLYTSRKQNMIWFDIFFAFPSKLRVYSVKKVNCNAFTALSFNFVLSLTISFFFYLLQTTLVLSSEGNIGWCYLLTLLIPTSISTLKYQGGVEKHPHLEYHVFL